MAEAKRRKYRGTIPDNVAFIPMVVDTYGSWGLEAREVLKNLAGSVAQNRGLKPALIFSKLKPCG